MHFCPRLRIKTYFNTAGLIYLPHYKSQTWFSILSFRTKNLFQTFAKNFKRLHWGVSYFIFFISIIQFVILVYNLTYSVYNPS